MATLWLEVLTMSAAILLDRLESVRKMGAHRWLARCPAHKDRNPSLSIRELEDGRTLLHCFGGCEALDVVDALGLSMTDLFPEPIGHHVRPSRSSIPARDLLAVISHESRVVAILARDLSKKRTLTEDDWKRLAEAVRRIGEARVHAYG